MNEVCDAIQNRLVKLHLTRIPITDDPEVKAHLAVCSTCRIYNDFLNHDHQELEAYAESLDTYVDNVKQKLNRRIKHTKPDSPRQTSFLRWTVAAAILLVAGLIFLFNGGPSTSSNQSGPDQNTANIKSPTPQVPFPTTQTVEMERQLARQHFELRNTTALLELLKSEHNETRVLAAHYLAEIGDSDSLPALERLAHTWDNLTVDNPYTQAIAQIQNRSQEPEDVTPEPEPTPVAVTPSIGRHINLDANGVKLEVVVTDKETGQPLAGVEVLFLSEPAYTYDVQDATGLTDANGICRIGHEKSPLSEAIIKVANPEFVSMRAEFKDLEQQDSPYQIHVALEPGSVIGGTVRDPNGDPLAGVQVQFDSGYKSFVDQEVFSYFDYKGKTDLQGHWSADSIPEKIRSLGLHFSHPDYAETGLAVVDPLMPEPDWNALAALREQIYEVTLSPGLSIWGHVTDANGSPVPGAEVTCRGHEKNMYTDTNGQYHIDHLPLDMSFINIVVSAENYPPTATHRDFGDREQPIDIVLRKGKVTEGEIVDSHRGPIEGVHVKASLDHAPSRAGWEAITDANGHYVLTSLPSDTMRLQMTHPNTMEYHRFFDAQKEMPQTVLHPPLHVQVEVRDVETGSLVPSFQLITGKYYKQEDLTTWNSENPIMAISSGRAEWIFTRQREAYALMIQAQGYRPALSRVLQPGPSHVKLSFDMEKGIDTTGTVVTAQGDPAPDIQVFLCQYEMELSVGNGTPNNDSTYFVRTDTNGQFLVESKRLVKYIVAIGTEGIAQFGYDDFLDHRVITLEPWVTVKGDLMVGANPAVGYGLETRTRDELEYRGGYFAYSNCNTDVQGRFEFNRIPPGHMVLYGREYEVHAGQTYELNLGVGGQSVAGQFVLPGYAHQERILNGGHVISLDAGKSHVNMSPRPGTARSQVFQEISSSETGRFQVDHLEPGHYALAGGVWENGNLDRQKHAYRWWHEFVVPKPSDETRGNIPLEIGNVRCIPGDLMVEDTAPDFDLPDLEGNMRSLHNGEDKLVLLSFYCSDGLREPSLELLRLNNVQNRFGTMESFVMIGMLASAYSPFDNSELVDAAGLTWPHLLVGRNGKNRTHIEYDVLNTPWPWNILISPDGVVLAIGLQGDELVEAIEAHMP